MSNEIINTADIAEDEWDGASEPGEVRTDMVATHDAEGKGIEFHVSMRDYTMRDMEALIVEAAAIQIVGRRSERELAKLIEERCAALTAERVDKHLATVTAEIIDQPLTPSFGDKAPVTMREFLGLYGREYLTERVGRDGNPSKGGWGSNGVPRIEWIVSRCLSSAFKIEIEKATREAIAQVHAAIKAQHQAILAEEKQRLRDALDKAAS